MRKAISATSCTGGYATAAKRYSRSTPTRTRLKANAVITARHIPGGVDAVVIATRPEVAEATMGKCAGLGIKHAWMHRPAFGAGSVSRKGKRLRPRARDHRDRWWLPADVQAHGRQRTQDHALVRSVRKRTQDGHLTRRHRGSRGTAAGAVALRGGTFHCAKQPTGHATLLKADVAVHSHHRRLPR